jgi:replicative DNA helicase
VPVDGRTVDGYAFAFDEGAAHVPSIWGCEDEILWARGEPLMLVAPEGCGKTTIGQQAALRRAGVHRSCLLGLPIERSSGRVLYVAADRPKQASRSIRRMVSEHDEQRLREGVVVHRGPLPFDITTDATALRDYGRELNTVDIFIDSLKDIAIGLADDKVGAAVAIAFQHVIADGRELVALHHQRKRQQGAPPPRKLEDVYGSRWLTACMGSVILLWGDPGDPIVHLTHLKQPIEEVGPFDVLHDHARGVSTLHDHTNFEQLLAANPSGLTARDGARLLFQKDAPPANEIEKTRRRLEGLVDRNKAERREDPTGAIRYYATALVRGVGHTVSPHGSVHPLHDIEDSSHTNGHTPRTTEDGSRAPNRERGDREVEVAKI